MLQKCGVGEACQTALSTVQATKEHTFLECLETHYCLFTLCRCMLAGLESQNSVIMLV